MNEEIEQVVFEYRMRQAIVAGTVMEIMAAAARLRTPQSIPPVNYPERLPY